MLPAGPVVVAGSLGPDDMTATRELLRSVASGRSGPALRVFIPAPTLAFGRRETHRAGYRAAEAATRRHGFEPVVRNTGGLAVAYHEGSLVTELLAADPSPPARLTERFVAFAGALAGALRSLGVPASVGRLDGEYCPGDHSVLAGRGDPGAGWVKLAGTAQRLVAGAWLCSASVVVTGAAPLRDVLTEVYGELGFAWRPATLGAAEDLVPSVTMAQVQHAVIDAFGAVRR